MRSKAKDWAREARRAEEVGEDAICYRCGRSEIDPVARVRAALLEEHHVDGRNHNRDFTVRMCRNCHEVMTTLYNDGGANMRIQPSEFEKIIHTLRARGILLEDLGTHFQITADEFEELIEQLDEACPDWREELDR